MYFWENTQKSTEDIAKELLGCLVVHETPEGLTSGWIVETEAYLGEKDQAAHSYQLRKTPRLRSMYQEPGTIYIYQMHTHFMLNVVVQEKGIPEAILVRAVQPEHGVELMKGRRKRPERELTDGPGKLTKAMGITKMNDGLNISHPPLFIHPAKKLNDRKDQGWLS